MYDPPYLNQIDIELLYVRIHKIATLVTCIVFFHVTIFLEFFIYPDATILSIWSTTKANSIR